MIYFLQQKQKRERLLFKLLEIACKCCVRLSCEGHFSKNAADGACWILSLPYHPPATAAASLLSSLFCESPSRDEFQ